MDSRSGTDGITVGEEYRQETVTRTGYFDRSNVGLYSYMNRYTIFRPSEGLVAVAVAHTFPSSAAGVEIASNASMKKVTSHFIDAQYKFDLKNDV